MHIYKYIKKKKKKKKKKIRTNNSYSFLFLSLFFVSENISKVHMFSKLCKASMKIDVCT